MATNKDANILKQNLLENISKCLLELQKQRNEVKELETKLAAECRVKFYLKIEMKMYTDQIVDLRNQLKATITSLNQKKSAEERFANGIRASVRNEHVYQENARLLQRLQATNNKLVELIQENGHLRNEVQIAQQNRSTFSQRYEETWKALSLLNRHFEQIEAQQKIVQRIHESSRQMTMRAQGAINYYKQQLEVERQAKKQLQDKLLTIEAKAVVQNLKTDTPQKTAGSRDIIVQQLQTKIRNLEAELRHEKLERQRVTDGFIKLTVVQQHLNAQLEKSRSTCFK